MENDHNDRHLSREHCFEALRRARFGETVECVHCESTAVVKRGTTDKDAQQYWCKACETHFNDLTGTVFGQRRFELEEMFYIVSKMQAEPTTQVARDLDRDYEAVLDFVHRIRDVRDDDDESTLVLTVVAEEYDCSVA